MNSNNFLLVITALNLILLMLTLYFLSNAMKTYGGKIGQSLNIIGLGIFGISIKETFSFMQTIFGYDFFAFLTGINIYNSLIQYTMNAVIFSLFAYGFYRLGNIFKVKSKDKE